jgi:hypothetical protein
MAFIKADMYFVQRVIMIVIPLYSDNGLSSSTIDHVPNSPLEYGIYLA